VREWCRGKKGRVEREKCRGEGREIGEGEIGRGKKYCIIVFGQATELIQIQFMRMTVQT
jgi:hypothetical protein